MADTNILQFPSRATAQSDADRSDILLAKIVAALRAMTALHEELESLKAMLKAQNESVPG